MARLDSDDKRPSQSDVDHGLTIVSQEGLVALAARVSSGVQLRGNSKKEFGAKLGSFLQLISSNPNISAVAFAYRRESYVRPMLDVYLLWSTPVNLIEDISKIREAGAIHDKTLADFNSLDSILHIIDPRRDPSVNALRREIRDEARSAAYMKLIACASFDRNNSVRV